LERSYQYRPAPFFLLAYAVTWTLWFVGIYVGSRPDLEAYGSVLSLVGLLGPIGTALYLVFTSGSEALRSDFKDRLFNLRRIRPIFVLAAVAIPFAVILSILLSAAFGQPTDQFKLSGGGNLLAMMILAMVLAPIMEEVGWHGYGVDSLRAKTGMLQATLLFGVLWSVWHAPLFLIGGTYQNALRVWTIPSSSPISSLASFPPPSSPIGSITGTAARSRWRSSCTPCSMQLPCC
jgi:uncharacterized protein